eukprot:9485132-Pyramimonas_sp.AAC.1
MGSAPQFIYKYDEQKARAIRYRSGAAPNEDPEEAVGEPDGPDERGMMTVTFEDGETWQYSSIWRPPPDGKKEKMPKHHEYELKDGGKVWVWIKNNKPKGKENQRLCCIMRQRPSGKVEQQAQLDCANFGNNETEAIKWAGTVAEKFMKGEIDSTDEATVLKLEKAKSLAKDGDGEKVRRNGSVMLKRPAAAKKAATAA